MEKDVAAGRLRVEFSYDYMGRRFVKTVYNDVAGAWQKDKETRFVYDGWNMFRETLTPAAGEAEVKSYAWGLDLSQSLQGAGGVGGLLAMTYAGEGYWYCYDGNGNVGQVVKWNSGLLSEQYRYDPYGKDLSLSLVDGVNYFMFSTKYLDRETRLFYYGQRYYSTTYGIWSCRDRIEEYGGINLYEICLNSTINYSDYIGLHLVVNGLYVVEKGDSLYSIWKKLITKHKYTFSWKRFQSIIAKNHFNSIYNNGLNVLHEGDLIDFRATMNYSQPNMNQQNNIGNVDNNVPINEENNSPFWQNAWFGVFGEAHGEIFVGRHGGTGIIYNMADINNWHQFTIKGWKFGGPGGGGCGAVLIIITNVDSTRIVGYTKKGGGVDWDFNLGGKIGDTLKGIGGVGKIAKLLKEKKNIDRARQLTEQLLKNADALGEEEKVITLTTPLGGGFEIWGGYKTMTLEVETYEKDEQSK